MPFPQMKETAASAQEVRFMQRLPWRGAADASFTSSFHPRPAFSRLRLMFKADDPTLHPSHPSPSVLPYPTQVALAGAAKAQELAKEHAPGATEALGSYVSHARANLEPVLHRASELADPVLQRAAEIASENAPAMNRVLERAAEVATTAAGHAAAAESKMAGAIARFVGVGDDEEAMLRFQEVAATPEIIDFVDRLRLGDFRQAAPGVLTVGRERPQTLTREQFAHIEAMLELSDNLVALRNKLCPDEMTTGAFWQARWALGVAVPFPSSDAACGLLRTAADCSADSLRTAPR